MQLSVALFSLVYLIVPVLSLADGDLSPLANGFSVFCDNIHLVDSSRALAATCANSTGYTNGEVTLPLNRCLANLDGVLVCQSGGGAMDTCYNCYLDELFDPTVIRCICQRSKGGVLTPTIDLNTCIGNDNGVLVC